MLSKMGLIGLYQSSNIRSNISSVYMISDEDTQSLYVFILFPGSYHDVYEIASLTAYTNIFIIPISMDPAYMSDVYRLVNELYAIKSIVKVIHPSKFTSYECNSLFLNSFVKGNEKSAFVYSSHGFIAFNWNDNETSYPSRLNDIYCTFNDRRVLLTSTKVDKDRIIRLFEEDKLDYVYVPWSKNSEYNSALDNNFLTLMDCEELIPYRNKIVPYGFSNQAEIDLCQEHFPGNFPVTIRHLFINTTMESDMASKVIWSEVDMRPHKPPHACVHKHIPFKHHIHHNACECENECPCKPKPEPEFRPDGTEIAISVFAEYCTAFEEFVKNCQVGCEGCKAKAFFEANTEDSEGDVTDEPTTDETITNPDDPTTDSGDNTETPSDNNDVTTEGSDTTTPDTENSSTETDVTDPTETPSDNETQTNGDDSTNDTNETVTEEETVEPVEQSTSDRLYS